MRRYWAYALKSPPTLDGKLDDACWRELPAAGGFMELGKQDPMAEQTDVQAGYDDKCLYLGIRCHEDAVDGLKTEARKSGDPAVFGDDAVEVFLSADPSGVPNVQLGLNSIGVGMGVGYDTNRKSNVDWKGTWRAAGA